jgi:hypothetical protein
MKTEMSEAGKDDQKKARDDRVEDAIEETFPASDPPAWSTPAPSEPRRTGQETQHPDRKPPKQDR